jgi:hypothetical protein
MMSQHFHYGPPDRQPRRKDNQSPPRPVDHEEQQYNGLGYHNIYTGIRVPPCPPCRKQANFLQNFDNNNPLLPNCTCRILPPSPDHHPQLIVPTTTNGITHNDIKSTACYKWTDIDWDTMVYLPLARMKIINDLGLILRFLVFLPHAIEAGQTLPANIRRILQEFGIISYPQLIVFSFRDLPNAFHDTKYEPAPFLEDIINKITTNRTKIALTTSCQFNTPQL